VLLDDISDCAVTVGRLVSFRSPPRCSTPRAREGALIPDTLVVITHALSIEFHPGTAVRFSLFATRERSGIALVSTSAESGERSRHEASIRIFCLLSIGPRNHRPRPVGVSTDRLCLVRCVSIRLTFRKDRVCLLFTLSSNRLSRILPLSLVSHYFFLFFFFLVFSFFDLFFVLSEEWLYTVDRLRIPSLISLGGLCICVSTRA